MFGTDTRAARAAWTVLLVALAAFVVYLIRRTILIFAVALLLAYLLSPIVSLVDRLTPRKFTRVVSLALVYVLLIALLGLVGTAVGIRVYQEAGQLSKVAPAWLKSGDLLAKFPVPPWLEAGKAKAVEAIRVELANRTQEIVPLIGEVGQRILSVLGNLGFVVLVPILSFFFLKDAPFMRQRILNQFADGPRHVLLEDILNDVHVLLGQFMRALVILGAATFVFYALFFLIIGMPYAALLAGLAGALEFIPLIGPLTAAVTILLVAILSGHLNLAVWALVFMLLYRLFQDYVLQPYLMGAGMELHPLWVIFGVLAGGQIGGVAGIFLSIPVMATLRVVYVRFLKTHHLVTAASDH